MLNIKPYAKAAVAGLSVTVAAAIPLVDGGLTAKDCLILVGAFLAGGFPTWAIPNKSASTPLAIQFDSKAIIDAINKTTPRRPRK